MIVVIIISLYSTLQIVSSYIERDNDRVSNRRSDCYATERAVPGNFTRKRRKDYNSAGGSITSINRREQHIIHLFTHT